MRLFVITQQTMRDFVENSLLVIGSVSNTTRSMAGENHLYKFSKRVPLYSLRVNGHGTRIIIKLHNETYLWQQPMDSLHLMVEQSQLLFPRLLVLVQCYVLRVFGIKAIQKCRLSETLKQARRFRFRLFYMIKSLFYQLIRKKQINYKVQCLYKRHTRFRP